MTREHFNSLAAALRSSKPNSSDNLISLEAASQQWQRTVESVANACAGWNPRFDRGKFLKAAGV